jgi:hypothetical protein
MANYLGTVDEHRRSNILSTLLLGEDGNPLTIFSTVCPHVRTKQGHVVRFMDHYCCMFLLLHCLYVLDHVLLQPTAHDLVQVYTQWQV